MKDKLQKIRDLFNEVVAADGDYDIGFYTPGPFDLNQHVAVMLGQGHGAHSPDVDVLAHIRYNPDTRRWNYFEGDVE